MEQIEIVELGYLSHARRQSKVVGREFEERIAGNGDFVVVNAVVASAEAEGLRVGNEMDLVPRSREFDAKFRGHHARAAIGGIAGDADAHAGAVLRSTVWRRAMNDRSAINCQDSKSCWAS